MAVPLPYYTITFDTNGGHILMDEDKEREYQVGKKYSEQGDTSRKLGFPPQKASIRAATGEIVDVYAWGGCGGRSWGWGNGSVMGQYAHYVDGHNFGIFTPNFDTAFPPWMELAQARFKGWYTEPVGGSLVDPDSVCDLTHDITLYAHWDFKTATFKFDAQGGEFDGGLSVVDADFDLSYGMPYGRFPVPTRTGFRFQGWYTLPKGMTLDDFSEQVLHYLEKLDSDYDYNEWVTEPRGGRKVIASDHYEPLDYDDGYSGLSISWETAGEFFRTHDTNFQMRNVAIMRFSWQWLGTIYGQGDPMTVPVLYAHWTDGIPQITLCDQGGSGGSGMVTAGASGVLPPVTPPTRSGYTFLGYFRYANGGGTKYYNADGTAANNWDDDSDGDIFAAWSVVRIPLTVNLRYSGRYNSGSLNSSIIAYHGERYGDLPQPPHVNGYSFSFWTVSGNTYPPSPAVPVLPTTICERDRDHYMIAIMNVESYDIVYETGGISLPAGSATTYSYNPSRDTALVSVPNMVWNGDAPPGYVFVGWYETPDLSGGAVTIIPRGSTGTKRYYAKWSPVNVTITLDANGGSVSPSSATRAYGTTYGDLPRPAKTSYVFAGWKTPGGDIVNVNSLVDAPSGAITLTAQWDITSIVPWGYVKYGIALELNGGEIADGYGELKYTKGYAKALPTAAQVTKSGATFGGWYGTSDFSGSAATEIPASATGEQKFYAKWIE